MSEKVEIIAKEQLEALPTKVLLARLQSLLRCEDRLEWPPGAFEKQLAEIELRDVIEFKHTQLWTEAYQELKAILSTREHIPNSEQRIQQRRDRAKRAKSKEKRRAYKH